MFPKHTGGTPIYKIRGEDFDLWSNSLESYGRTLQIRTIVSLANTRSGFLITYVVTHPGFRLDNRGVHLHWFLTFLWGRWVSSDVNFTSVRWSDRYPYDHSPRLSDVGRSRNTSSDIGYILIRVLMTSRDRTFTRLGRVVDRMDPGSS